MPKSKKNSAKKSGASAAPEAASRSQECGLSAAAFEEVGDPGLGALDPGAEGPGPGALDLGPGPAGPAGPRAPTTPSD